MELVLAAVVNGIFALVVAITVARQSKKTNEIHRQVTVNHHSSSNPTILDKLDNIEKAFLDHLNWHLHRDENPSQEPPEPARRPRRASVDATPPRNR